MRLIIPLLIFSAVLQSACAPRVEYMNLSGVNYPKTNPNEIRIYNQTVPDEPYEEIAIIRVEGKRRHNLNYMIGLPRNRAAEQGAHAVILRDPKEVHAGYVASGSLLIVVRNKVLQGTAIRFKENR